MQISVIGCGYVGLVTGTCLAEIGHEILCTDKDEAKLRMLQAGKLPVYEPHLEALVAENRNQGRLHFVSDPGAAVRGGDVIIICVGTPPLKNGDADLRAIDSVARLIATEAHTPKLVVEKSTVPAQTGQKLKEALAIYNHNAHTRFRVASNPEFLREGTAVADFLHPDRIVIGVGEASTKLQLEEIYRPILEGRFHCPVHTPACPPGPAPTFLVTTISSAELIKHASNSFLALKISYANAIAELCESLGADVEEVTLAMGLDPRIGPEFLRAGLGFGGFCLPKDIQAFIRLAERAGMDFRLLKEAERINNRQIERFLEKVRRTLWVIKGKQIGLLGLAFKPNTDDIRFAPPLELMRRLLAEGAQLCAYDPQAIEKTRTIFPTVRYAVDPYEAAKAADALLIATEWDEFHRLDWERIRDSMARPLVLDGRNLMTPSVMKNLGFEYHSIGRLS